MADIDPVSQLNEEQLQEFKDVFALFDKDGDDRISRDDLSKVLQALGQDRSPERVTALLAEADPDNEGQINFHSFLALLSRKMLDHDTEAEIREAFEFYDRDRDGLISAADLQMAFAELGEAPTDGELEAIVLQHGDGHINYESFVKLVVK